MPEPAEEIQFLTQWRLVRSAIEHENTLKSHRVTWFLATQLFLFTGFTSIFIEAVKNDSLFRSLKVYSVLAIIFLLGIYVCILAWTSLCAAQKMIARLQNWWLIHCHNTSDNWKDWILSAKYGTGQKSFPPVNGIFTSNMHIIFDETYLPVALALFWSILFLMSTLMVFHKRFEAPNLSYLIPLLALIAILLVVTVSRKREVMNWMRARSIVKFLRATNDRKSDELARILEKRGKGKYDSEVLRKAVKNLLDDDLR
ncbi:MAG: hypothetical protein VKN56_05295 [Cyanobacteriota bacterium]|nr:hypothetical protein [Cyanobacteriota bacterium]